MFKTYYLIFVKDKGYFYKNIFDKNIDNSKKYLSLRSVIKSCFSLSIKIPIELMSVVVIKEKVEVFEDQKFITRKIKQTLNYNDIKHYINYFELDVKESCVLFIPSEYKNVSKWNY